MQTNQAVEAAPLTPPQVRRNFVLGVLNGTLLRVLDTAASPSLVLPWFVSHLGGSAVAVGLLVPIANGGWFLPQLLMARFVHPLRHKLPLYRAASTVRVLVWVLMVAIIALVGSRNSTFTLWSFLLLYAVFCFGSGVSGLPWLDVIARAIPGHQRGRFFGWREFTGGILAIGASILVQVALNESTGPRFPYNYALLFTFAGAAGAAAYYLFGRITEPTESDLAGVPATVSGAPLHWTAPLSNRSFRLFLWTRMAIMAATVALPFYGLYAKQRLGAPDEMAGTYSGALTAALVVSTLLWGRLSDRKGNLLVLRVVSVGFLLLALLPLLLGPRVSYLAYTVVFVLLGAVYSGSDIALLAMGLELAPPEQRSAYLGLLNTALGVVSILLILGGWIVAQWGLEAVFVVSAAMAAIAIVTVRGLPDPRATIRGPVSTDH